MVRPTLRGALLGKEIGTSQSTLPVGVGRFGGTPHIVLSGAFLALSAPECRYGLVGGLWDNGANGTQEEPAGFRRNTRALRVLGDSSCTRDGGLHGLNILLPLRGAGKANQLPGIAAPAGPQSLKGSAGPVPGTRAMKPSISWLGMWGFCTKQRDGGNAISDCFRPRSRGPLPGWKQPARFTTETPGAYWPGRPSLTPSFLSCSRSHSNFWKAVMVIGPE